MASRSRLVGLAVGACALTALPSVCAGTLEDGFGNPPSEARPRTWWHWVDNNITHVGITRDLEAMKRAGLGGATILDVSSFGGGLKGKVKTLSPAWFDCVAHAVREAKRLGLELSVANCPGWSSSGGPWIRPEEAMKSLGFTETTVTGGRRLSLTLAQCERPERYGRDVAVLAFPAICGDGYDFKADVVKTTIRHDSSLTFPPGFPHAQYRYAPETLWDGRSSTCVMFNPSRAKETEAIEFELRERRQMRSVRVDLSQPPWGNRARYRILVSEDGMDWKEHCVTPPVVKDGGDAAFPPVTSRFFRLEPRDCGWLPIAAVRFSPAWRIPDLTLKTFFHHGLSATAPTHVRDMPSMPKEGAVDPDRIVDLTASVAADGRLEWDAPAGRWTILRFTMYTRQSGNHPANPEGRGLECDKMSRRGVEAAWRGMMRPILDRAKAAGAAGVVTGTLIDSYEVWPQNWTEEMPAEFRALRGYDLVKFLPVFSGRYVKDALTSERFLEDFRRTVSDLYAKYYGDGFRRLANRDGVQLELEPYGGPFDDLLQGRGADIPMGEFWQGPSWGVGNAKLASNVADVYGKRYVQTESFSAGDRAAAWTSCPARHKLQGDSVFAQGVNRLVLHSFAHQAYETTGPGLTVGPWGFHFNRHNTLWPFYRGWLDYVSRAQFLLQQGRTVTDVLYVTREDTPVTPTFQPATPYGWNFNAIDARTFAKGVRAVDGLAEIPGGRRYAVVVLPQAEIASAPLLAKAEALRAAGVAVVRGPKPVRSFGLADRAARDRAVTAFAENVWGRLHRTVDAALAAKGIAPDFAATGDGDFVRLQQGKVAVQWIHRQTDDRDIYFVANVRQAEAPLAFVATFRTVGEAELWDAETGTRRPAPARRVTGGRMELPLELAHGTSVFVVFRRDRPPVQAARGVGRAGGARSPENVATLDCSTGWTVRFQEGRGAPEGEVPFGTLMPLNERPEPGIRYFSGTATYRKTIDVPAEYVERTNCAWSLDLGHLHDIAGLTVNGRDLGFLWHYPFRRDVTDILKPGRNVIEVRVANRWINRLIGDEQEAEAGSWVRKGGGPLLLREFPEGYVDGKLPKGHFAFTTCRPYAKGDPLQPAGLLGPVRLLVQRREQETRE